MAGTRLQGFTTALTDIDTAAQEYMGAIRDDYNASYKYVEFSGTTAVAVGDVVCYLTTDNTQTIVDGANTALGAGVAMAAHASGSITYGWIQIRGVATLSTAIGGSTPAVGNEVTTAGASAAAVTKRANATDLTVGVIVHVSAPIVINTQFPN